MSTVNLQVNISLKADETLAAASAPAAGSAGDRKLNYNGFATVQTLTSTSTPAVELAPISQEKTLSGGTDTIDLTAAATAVSRTIDCTGKKLVAAKFKTPSTNSGNVTIQAGSSNGYNLFGASGLIVLTPGQSLGLASTAVASAAPAVSASLKNIAIAGTASDKLQLILYLGT